MVALALITLVSVFLAAETARYSVDASCGTGQVSWVAA